MNPEQTLTEIANQLELLSRQSNADFQIQARRHRLIIEPRQLKKPTEHTVALISHRDAINGLTSNQWDNLMCRIAKLQAKGILCQHPLKPSPSPNSTPSSTPCSAKKEPTNSSDAASETTPSQ